MATKPKKPTNKKPTKPKIPKDLANKDVPKYYKYTYVANDGKIVGSNISQETAYSYLLNRNNKYAEKQNAQALKEDREQADYNNAWSAQQAQINRDWQEQMSNTAHQREVKDLVAAGLNPVLSANGGAAVPAGSVGTTDTGTTGLAAQKMMKSMDLRAQRDMAELQAGIQLEMNKQNIASAQKMAKWQNALQKELGYAGLANNLQMANISAGASMYAANQAAAASMYGANQSAAAMMYGANKNYDASIYATNNPSSMWAQLNQLLSGKSNSGKMAYGLADKIMSLFGVKKTSKKGKRK